jgi:hypothetical protein
LHFVSTIGESHPRIKGYDYAIFVDYVKSFSPDNIIVSYLPSRESLKENGEIRALLDDRSICDKVVFAGVDRKPYDSFKEQYFKDRSASAEVLVKRNVLDIIDTTVFSYLENYWKNPETVNSDITDSLFRAKHKLIASMFWEMEKYTWEQRHQEILKNILTHSTHDESVVISDVESRYWYLDQLQKMQE